MYLIKLLTVLICEIIVVFVGDVASLNEGCSFAISKNTPKTLLILKNQNTPEFLYPSKERNVIHIPKGDKIRLSCAGKYLEGTFYAKELDARCVKNDIIQLKYHILWKQKTKLQQLECKSKPEPVIQFTDKRCSANNIIIEIGYVINKRFLKVYSVCFDNFEEKTLYSWYKNSKLYLGHEEKIKNSAYSGHRSFSFNISRVYEYDHQERMFTKILRSEDLAERYIRNNNLLTIINSPLLTKDEFVYGPEQMATFHYLNTAPQWKIFSEGNWAVLKRSLTNFLTTQGHEYGVASGVYGVTTLPDLFKEEKKIYLFIDKFENNYLPLPKYYWKILYNYESKTGTAFIGMHDPFLDREIYQDLIFCQDICEQIKWLKVDNDRHDQGYMFCCDIKEFFKITGYENMFE